MAKAGTVNPANLLGDATRSADLRHRLLFLVGALVVYRIGTFIPVPGIDPDCSCSNSSSSSRARS